jgi:hypothetical protein
MAYADIAVVEEPLLATDEARIIVWHPVRP